MLGCPCQQVNGPSIRACFKDTVDAVDQIWKSLNNPSAVESSIGDHAEIALEQSGQIL
jgi:hypothetical protein